MNVKKERIFYFDFLRTFAIIGVIICHTLMFWGDLNTFPKLIIQGVFHEIGRMGVPIFLMISGALLLRKDYDLLDFLKRRFTRIIYPFIFWIAIIIFQHLLYNGSYERAWIIFTGNPSITWYFWTLIGIYLFIPVIRPFIKEYGEKGLKYFLIIWFVTLTLKTFNFHQIFPYFDLNNFSGYIGYPLLGYYLDNKDFKIDNFRLCILGLFIFVASLSVYTLFDYYHMGIELIYLNVPIIIVVCGFYMFVKAIAKMNLFDSIKNNLLGKIIVSISICSYGMYFTHIIIIKFISTFNPHSLKLFPLMFIIIVFFSWSLPYIVSNMPYLKKFSGI